MGDSSAFIPRERVLAVCGWAEARFAEVARERDAATLRAEVGRRNRLRRLVRMRPLSGAEVHERLLGKSCSYPWRCWRGREASELLALARDAEGHVRVGGRAWRDLLRWCADNGWRDAGRPDPAE